ncbi:MAG: hypothetical protein AAF799_15815 [Myxococcota bacterium]
MDYRLVGLAAVVGLGLWACGNDPVGTSAGTGSGDGSPATAGPGESTADTDPADGTAEESEGSGSGSDAPSILATAVTAGLSRTCALLEDGTVRCWGWEQDGTLGQTTAVDRCDCIDNAACCLADDEPLADLRSVSLGGTVTRVSMGTHHACALLEDDTVRCWGFGGAGALGRGDTETIGDDELPVDVPALDLGEVVELQVSSGRGSSSSYQPRHGRHTCARRADGTVLCWGDGTLGAPGFGHADIIGDDESAETLEPLALRAAVTQLALGGAHTCVRLADGGVQCWGFNNRSGNLGRGIEAKSCSTAQSFHCDSPGCCVGHDEATWSELSDVPLGGPATSISAGAFHTCAILEGGDVRCWGSNAGGELGYGHTDDIGDDEVPADVPPLQLSGPAVALSAGRSHTCALLEGGSVQCWGSNTFGALGYGHTEDIGDDETPMSAGTVRLGGTAVAIAAGSDHTCALLDDGTLRCFGNNGRAALGYLHADECYDEAMNHRCEHDPVCCIGDDDHPEDFPPVPL